MTIDERLDRLTERHEALAQTIELWIAENRTEHERLRESIASVAAMIRNLAVVADGQTNRIEQLLVTSDRQAQRLDQQGQRLQELLLIAENHERRLTRLEQQ